MNKYKINYYLDYSDQIEVDGHILSRLYMAEPTHKDIHVGLKRPAVYGEDNTGRSMGGYVESLKSLSTKVDNFDHIAWVDENSKVYGDSKICTGVSIVNSTIVDSTVKPVYFGCGVRNSTIINSTVASVDDSRVIDSECVRDVDSSVVENSNVTTFVKDSTIIDSKITGRKNEWANRANLTNVEHNGGISGTFSNINLGDIQTHVMYHRHGDMAYPFNLLVGPNGELGINEEHGDVLIGDARIPQGDVSLETVSDALRAVVDGKPVGTKKTLQKLDELEKQLVLTDSDLDFGDELTR